MSHAACIRHLRDYVAIPSLNPMGREDIPAAIVGETRLATHLREQLRGIGIDAELVGEGDRQSIVAEIRSPGVRETVLVASHLDTVPIDGMEIDPFDPVIESGRLLGRGSCDTKAGMAALVAALERVLDRGKLVRNVILVGEADEEKSSAGVRDVLDHLGGRLPDWVLATEPTSLEIVHRHKGVVHAVLEATGRACHASDPGAGSNAILSLCRAALALEDLAARLDDKRDPELGPATLSVGMMSGGQAPNVVPNHAQLWADRRLLPGEDLAEARAEIESAIRAAGVADAVALTQCTLEKPTLGTPSDHSCVLRCGEALTAAGLPVVRSGVAFGTDAGVFERAGIPGVVMGPGSIERAHTAREYVEVDQVEAMTDFFLRLIAG